MGRRYGVRRPWAPSGSRGSAGLLVLDEARTGLDTAARAERTAAGGAVACPVSARPG
ncbi:hypothetical protein [Streptomyces sp. NPDC001194]|uniref:hypothetical protein n=1 Tax=Streptomyces sp. NPDC001194 TaxID=3364547 RepID=UPI0036C80578